MEYRCSYGDCPGSPKHSCSCDHSLKYCEFHMDKHLGISKSHSIRPLIKLGDQSTSNLLAKEMKNLSSTMAKVMLTGKEMFEEICKKLCQITGELTERQDKLIEIASNLSEADYIPQQSLKDLGDLKIKFKSSEEFKKVVEDHFSNDTTSVDFSLFSDDIKNIMSHLQQSNILLEEVRNQSEQDKKAREDIKIRLEKIENSKLQMEQNIKSTLHVFDSEARERERRFTSNDKTQNLQDRIQVLEQLIEIQNNAIEEVYSKYNSTVCGLAAQNDLHQSQDKKMKEFKEKSENDITFLYNQHFLMIQQKILEANQILENNLNQHSEQIEKREEDLRVFFKQRIYEINENFNLFCEKITEDSQLLNQEIQIQINRFDKEFGINVRREIDYYKQLKKDEAARNQREIERRDWKSNKGNRKRKNDKKEAGELDRVQSGFYDYNY